MFLLLSISLSLLFFPSLLLFFFLSPIKILERGGVSFCFISVFLVVAKVFDCASLSFI